MISAFACFIGLPVSSASRVANSSKCSRISAPTLLNSRPRSVAESCPHAPSNAERAARTARSMSAAFPAAISVKALPFVGLITGIVRLLSLGCQELSKKMPIFASVARSVDLLVCVITSPPSNYITSDSTGIVFALVASMAAAQQTPLKS